MIVVENDPTPNNSIEFPKLRRTHTICCAYCDNRWKAVDYGNIRSGVCWTCKQDIKNVAVKKIKNLRKTSEMEKFIQEIVNTPMIVVENDPTPNNSIEFPKLRRTHTICCAYCDNRWGAVDYGNNRSGVCWTCKQDIKNAAVKKMDNLRK